MTETEAPKIEEKSTIAKLPILAALVALAGIADAIFLTVHHYNAEPVPCGGPFDCEMVLSSPYSTLSGFVGNVPVIGDMPLSIFGAVAYFIAFCFAILAAFGDRRTWPLFGVQSTLMATFACYLFYLQSVVIRAYCQWCLISAGISAALFIIFIISIFVKRRTA